jgi:hypothetical protein
MQNYLAAVLFLCVFVSAQAQHDQGASPAASKTNDTFNLIKALVGDWQGSYEWIGKNRKGPMNARYYVTGNGTAVVEDLIVDGNANMTTVYHLEGADLRATHYCAAGNQPRLKEASTEGDNKVVKFHMVDITNLPTPEAGHVRDLELRLTSTSRITVLFTFVGSGKESVEGIELARKA